MDEIDTALIFSAAPGRERPSPNARARGTRPTGIPPVPAGARRILVDSGAQAHTITSKDAIKPDGLPLGSFGRPNSLVDGGGNRHMVSVCGTYSGRMADGRSLHIKNASHSPTFGADVLSVGVLRENGTVAHFGDDPRLVATNGSVVHMQAAGGLFYLDVYDTFTSKTHNAAVNITSANNVSYIEMHMHEQAPSTKGHEPHNRPLSTSAPGTSHAEWSWSLLCLRMILKHPQPGRPSKSRPDFAEHLLRSSASFRP